MGTKELNEKIRWLTTSESII